MKRFKSTAKDDQAPTAQAKGAKGSANALIIGIVSLLLGAMLVLAAWWQETQQQQQQQQLTWGQQQADNLQRALNQLNADLQAAANNPALLQALQSPDPLARLAIERDLAYRDLMLDAHLNLRAQATPNSNRAAPINFAALEMLQRVENGETVPAEAYRIGNRWVVYQATAVREAGNEQPLGSLMFAVDLRRLVSQFTPHAEDLGQLRLTQKFTRSPEQELFSSGNPGAGEPIPFNTGNPNWLLTLNPHPHAVSSILVPGAVALALLIALAGLFFALRREQASFNTRLNADVEQLQQLINEVAHGKAVKAFSLGLSALDPLTRNLAHLSLRKAEAASSASAAAHPATATEQPPKATAADNQPLFGDDDVLDIDFLDDAPDYLALDSQHEPSERPPQLPASIFRAYDIRGIVGDTLTAATAYWLGRTIGSQSLAQGEPHVNVGRDGRLSGPEMAQQLIQGLLDSGCHVTDIGLVPTPALYFACHTLKGRSGVMITGSHNPPDYNGFKIMIAGDTLADEQIQNLNLRLQNNDLASGVGSLEQVDILPQYLTRIRDDVVLAKPLRVVVDCGNGAAGVIAPQLLEALGCTVIPLYCEVDGTFPNHHPDPGKPENLTDLIAAVQAHQADLGLAFDGDGDRVGVVTNQGSIVFPDRLLMLFAKDVVSRNPGADILFDVKCTRRLIALISGYGGRPVMWKTGHSLMKKKMKETGALLAGEMSGHIFFQERWYGFDDGIYAAARLLEILSLDKLSAEQIFAKFPNDVSTPELNIAVTEQNKFRIIETLQRNGHWGEANLTTLDGIRVDYPKGWGLVRASNTTPVLVLRFEAETPEELARIQDVFRAQLYTVAPDLNLPF